MRRAIPLFALVGATTLGTLALPASGAQAAEGALWLNAQRHDRPSGCYATQHAGLAAVNRTNTTAFIFRGNRCKGDAIASLDPNRRGTFEFGQSVYIA
ncbi:hypothetical protein [Actinomadura roseirufa]|uniref:hypothetical protein n=1 Tax=Actinomadura roseirufa TaxID=2094049 RepID=UPI00104126FF|nr:hypothetical protein [Actinomadura roseirufa]